MEILAFLEQLSELTMPDGTNVLEHLFKIDDVMLALLQIWFFIASVHNQYSDAKEQHFWKITDKWLKIVTAITKFNSFNFNTRDSNNEVYRTCVQSAISFIQHKFRNVLFNVMYVLSSVLYTRARANLYAIQILFLT